ncbi:hypothetical protein [Kamptonema formosum]|uniref:hypothetical protein n=1 Tax=Kamptonema formosum TaxID=331992 RepID=UPI0012DEEB5F|nr:hypothetical protein [Oscillatoria sp. PCC 10802]
MSWIAASGDSHRHAHLWPSPAGLPKELWGGVGGAFRTLILTGAVEPSSVGALDVLPPPALKARCGR